MKTSLTQRRLLLLFPIILILLIALWGGVYRIGWEIPREFVISPGLHGPMMVSAFLGSLIILERAVAINQKWTYLGAIFGSLGGLLMIFGVPEIYGASMIFVASIWLVLIFVVIVKRHPVSFTYLMMLGALCWVWGNWMWLRGSPVAVLVLWWANFLILTIVGERIELGQILRLPKWTVWLVIGLCLALPLIGIFVPGHLQVRLSGLIYILLGFWLLNFDIASRTIKHTGLPKYAATALLAGYYWLIIGGVLGLTMGEFSSTYDYDAFLHSIFIGFIMSMVFAHGPIIFPGIFQKQAVFSKQLYVPLALLHTSMLMRLLGDLFQYPVLRRWGGLLNATAILIFLPMVMYLLFFKKEKQGT